MQQLKKYAQTNKDLCLYCKNNSKKHTPLFQYCKMKYYDPPKQINKINQIKSIFAQCNYSTHKYLFYEGKQLLQRMYKKEQFIANLININDKYFNEDHKPCIFHKQTSQTYMKWKQNKKKLHYKKLDRILNQIDYKPVNAQQQQKINNPEDIFLKQISEYNPKSLKYHLKNHKSKQKNQTNKKKSQEINQKSLTLKNIQQQLKNIFSKHQCIQDLSFINKQKLNENQKFQNFDNKNYIPTNSVDKLKQKQATSRSKIQYNFRKKQVKIQDLYFRSNLKNTTNKSSINSQIKISNNKLIKMDGKSQKKIQFFNYQMQDKLNISKTITNNFRQISLSNLFQNHQSKSQTRIVSNKLKQINKLQTSRSKKSNIINTIISNIDEIENHKKLKKISNNHQFYNAQYRQNNKKIFRKVTPNFFQAGNINLHAITMKSMHKNQKLIQNSKIKQICRFNVKSK